MPGVDLCGLPVGAFETEEELITALNGWASNPTTNGGAFNIRKQSFAPECNSHGFRRLLVCDRYGAARRHTAPANVLASSIPALD